MARRVRAHQFGKGRVLAAAKRDGEVPLDLGDEAQAAETSAL
jgi:hypothetical protein